MTLALRSTTVLAEALVDTFGPFPDTPPAVVILADGTFLVACAVGTTANRDTHMWHMSATGSVLGATTVSGPVGYSHPGLAWVGGQDALLIISESNGNLPSSVYPVTATGGSITVGAGVPSAAGHLFGDYRDGAARVSHTTPDGITWYLGARGVAAAYTAAGVQIGHHNPSIAPNYVTGWGVHPLDPTRVGVVYAEGGTEYVVTPGGMTATARPEWAHSIIDWPLAASNPFIAPARVVEAHWPPPEWVHTLVTHDGSGSIIDTYPLPEGTLSAGGAHPVDGGGVLVIQDNEDPGRESATPHAVLATPAGLSVVPMDWGRTSGPGVSWAFGSFATAIRGNAVVAAGVSTSYGFPNYMALTVWLLDLGGPVEGVLAIDTHDHPWHLVGTRDRSMPYELVIDTGTERLVEIVAGEESAATHELVIDEGGRLGDPWTHVGLFRPL